MRMPRICDENIMMTMNKTAQIPAVVSDVPRGPKKSASGPTRNAPIEISAG
jgi:hypothetical protein